MDRFCLASGYRSRPAVNAGLITTDHAQLCVYRFGREIAAQDMAVKTVLDWGCGTGAKLVELFADYDTLGVDVGYRLESLRARFPTRKWDVVPVPVCADLVLCVDVIEHLDDPTALLRMFAAGTWRHLLISTPERRLVAKHKCQTKQAKRRQINGPPANRWHAREWTAAEFATFLSRELRIRPQISVLRKYNLVAYVRRP